MNKIVETPVPATGPPTIVYSLWNEEGDCLYIGVTTNLRRRFQQHARLAAWWPEASRYQPIELTNPIDARTVERALIRAYKPLHNTRHMLHEPDRIGRDIA